MVFTDEEIRNIFGNEAAEDENIERLKEYYLKGNTYESMRSNIPLYILVGHKGTGKSALLSVLKFEQEEEGNIAISIQPDDIEGLSDCESQFNILIRQWKRGLSNIIFQKLMVSVSDKAEKDSWAKSVLELASSLLGKKTIVWEEEEVGDKDFIKFFRSTFFAKKEVIIYIDDLDRGWKNRSSDIMNISALLNAVRDMSRDIANLKFRIALRSDVYYAVRTSDESTDKIEGSVLWNSWSNHEILVMLIKRILTAQGEIVDEESLLNMRQQELQKYLFPLFDERFHGRGNWENAPIYRVLMSLIRKRPRDLIKLCTMAAKRAHINKHEKIMTEDLESIFNEYSNGRLQDTINEYTSEFPQIDDLLLKMKPTVKEVKNGNASLFTRDELTLKLKNIMERSSYGFADRSRIIDATNLAAFLYKINFLTARKEGETGDIQRIYYDENQYLLNKFTDFGYKYEIHPAYRWALQPDGIGNLYSQIELTDE